MPENLPVTEPHWIEDDRGQRHYLLHDDLHDIKLQPALIRAPPLGLLPAVVARVAASADVEELLLKPLRAGT